MEPNATSRSLSTITLACAIGALALACRAWAQDEDNRQLTPEPVLENIVVTAQRIEQTANEVGMDIQVFTGEQLDTPPSGHVAGIWARTDSMRGVHKAPANELVRGAIDVTQRLTFEEQGVLNPAGVNCIRYFPREGIRVWGARTLADAASEWRYLNVRRLFNMIEESIAEATRWIVFEPNDRTLWKSIRRDIGAFLTRVWRDGALMGRTADQAFFVKCDGETTTANDRNLGIVNIQVGFAPLKPAEFVIITIQQIPDV